MLRRPRNGFNILPPKTPNLAMSLNYGCFLSVWHLGFSGDSSMADDASRVTRLGRKSYGGKEVVENGVWKPTAQRQACGAVTKPKTLTAVALCVPVIRFRGPVVRFSIRLTTTLVLPLAKKTWCPWETSDRSDAGGAWLCYTE